MGTDHSHQMRWGVESAIYSNPSHSMELGIGPFACNLAVMLHSS